MNKTLNIINSQILEIVYEPKSWVRFYYRIWDKIYISSLFFLPWPKFKTQIIFTQLLILANFHISFSMFFTKFSTELAKTLFALEIKKKKKSTL